MEKIKGIYSIKINNKLYIGKDTLINKKRRLKQHLNLLNNNEHYNKHLQNAYNKYNGEYEYKILFQIEEISREELSEKEIYFINLYKSFENGYNLTQGGEGMNGFIFNEKSQKKKSDKFIGENNPLSKITNEQFFEIVDMLKEGLTNGEISKKYKLHTRYISLIRHKKRFKKLWELVDNYEPIQSKGRNKMINEDIFIKIIKMIKNGETNAEIERVFSLSSGTASRIRHKKIYKELWEKVFIED